MILTFMKYRALDSLKSLSRCLAHWAIPHIFCPLPHRGGFKKLSTGFLFFFSKKKKNVFTRIFRKNEIHTACTQALKIQTFSMKMSLQSGFPEK